MRANDIRLGLLVLALGAAGLFFAQGLRLGTAARIGPGYFPTAVSAALVLVGLALAARGWRDRAPSDGHWQWRGVALVALALVLFALAIERLGLVIATALLMATAALASSARRWLEIGALACVAALGAWLLFVRALGLPLKVLPW